MTLRELSQETLYTKGKNYNKDDLRQAQLQEVWVRLVPPGKRKPPITTFTVTTSEPSVGDELITVTPDESGTVYERDVIAFYLVGFLLAFSPVVVRSKTSFTANTEFTLPVLPIVKEIVLGSIGGSYQLKPFLSINSGGQPTQESQTFSSRNRHAGLGVIRAKSDLKTSIAMAGEVVGTKNELNQQRFSDPGLIETQKAETTSRALYVESRYVVYDDLGTGYGQGAGRTVVQKFAVGSPDRNGFQSISINLEIDGGWHPYFPPDVTELAYNAFLLGFKLLRFCVNNAPSTLIPEIISLFLLTYSATYNSVTWCLNTNPSNYIIAIISDFALVYSATYNSVTWCLNNAPSPYITATNSQFLLTYSATYNSVTWCDNNPPSAFILAT